MDELFTSKKDSEGRNIAIVESLNVNYKKQIDIVKHAGAQLTWKEAIINYSVNLSRILILIL